MFPRLSIFFNFLLLHMHAPDALIFCVNAREGTTVYTLTEEGLVGEQAQTWDISPLQALVEAFTPSWGPAS